MKSFDEWLVNEQRYNPLGNQQSMLQRGTGVSNPGQPMPTRPTVSGPSRQAPVQQVKPQVNAPVQPQNKTTKFNSAFLQDVKTKTKSFHDAAQQYFGIVASSLPKYQEEIHDAWEQYVGPMEKKLMAVYAKIDNLLAQAKAARGQR